MNPTARHGLLASAALAASVAVALLTPSPGSSEGAPATVGPLPLLGSADPDTTLMGAAPEGTPGEAWGYRQLPLTVGEARVDGQPLAFGPTTNPLNPNAQLVFLRHTDATGWQVFQTPRDEQGQPYRGPIPNRLSARTTRRGGGVLVGRDVSQPVGSQVVLLHRDPGGQYQALVPPPADVLLAAGGGQPAEALAEDNGSGPIAITAFDEGSRTGLLIAPTGRAVASGVIHYDGTSWTREPVAVPAGSEASFQILALDATEIGNAWALARTDPALGRGLVLLQRTTTSGGPLWVERDLGTTPFRDAATPASGIEDVQALGGGAQPLTVTDSGVWIDGQAKIGGVELTLTVYFDLGAGAGQVTRSWCDATACNAPLGAELSQAGGYRSFAWDGPDFGTRVVTNPLDPGDDEESNRGTYLRFAAGAFERRPGGGGSFHPSGAFTSVDDGWLEGPVQISASVQPQRLRSWPIALRAPLADVTPAPNAAPGAIGSQALAVGADGAVARYAPGRGWKREYLLSSSGSVNRSTLRGVAWPEPARAHAVGDLGAMWQWNADDGLWIADPGAPIGFEGNLTDIAFQSGDPDRGYAVGKGGVLLAYGKSWEQEQLPAEVGAADLTSIAFAGGQAIVAAGDELLVNDGGGWRVDASARALLDGVRAGNPRILTVAGLPDGGAVAGGRDIVLERDGPSAPWRFSSQPLPGSTVVAAAAIRTPAGVRAVVSVVPQLSYPPADSLPEPDPNVPAPIVPPFQLPGDGYLLRETESGWTDEQRTAFGSSGNDRPLKSDPILGLLLDTGGDGWAVGGWSGDGDAAGRGSSARNAGGRAIRARVRTAGIYRYGASSGAPPSGAGANPVPLGAGPVRLAVAGHAQCDSVCADLAPQSLGPDRTLAAALRTVASLHGTGNGPRALLYTGNRVSGGLSGADGARYAALLGSEPSLPVFPALGSSDVGDGNGAVSFRTAFTGFSAPFGSGSTAAGISSDGIPGVAPQPGARTHYAFDSNGPSGRVRVVVIDNSRGSLAASDPHQNPDEDQAPWLEAVLADARDEGVPVVVMGNRDLNTRFTPGLNVASDGNEVARMLVEGGASTYVYDRPEENRATRIPAGARDTIPSFGTGTLGYRSPISGAVGLNVADALFGDSGVLMLEVEANRRDATTNRAPVSVRLLPVIEDLSLEATDGTLLRRSRPALFRGLGRRPRGGDRWGRASAGSGNPDPSGGDPYTPFPPEQCTIPGCSARIAPEYSFSSSDPDIADFVKQDPVSTNLRKPLLGSDDKVVSDSASGLLCPFNAGTTTITVSAGGYSYSEPVTVQGGSVQRPCGTRPLRPDRFRRTSTPTAVPPPPPPPPPPGGSPPLTFQPPPPGPVSVPPPVSPPPVTITPTPTIPTVAPLVPAAAAVIAAVPALVPPPPPPAVRPMPPGGAPARVYQVEKEEEREVATEESQAFSRYDAQEGPRSVPPYLLALVLLAAISGASIRGGGGARRRAEPATADTHNDQDRRSRP